MFEKYTEKARRVIFFARYEASLFGVEAIETEHLLLGLLRGDKALLNPFLAANVSVDEVRRQIEKRTQRGTNFSRSVELPLSERCRKSLEYAADESTNMGHKHIGTKHLLMGLLGNRTTLAGQILGESGVNLRGRSFSCE